MGDGWIPQSTDIKHTMVSRLSLTKQIDNAIELPVFPLRRSVKLPTEIIKLSLYESRYLQMAQDIIGSENQVFGAFYSSDKPQIVKAGSGPVVPMMERNDLGVICWVYYSERENVPTRDGLGRRDLIRLFAVAGCRFRVDEVLNTGYDANLPYIRAKVSPVLGKVQGSASLLDVSSANEWHEERCKFISSRYGFSSTSPNFEWIQRNYRKTFGSDGPSTEELSTFCLATRNVDKSFLAERKKLIDEDYYLC